MASEDGRAAALSEGLSRLRSLTAEALAGINETALLHASNARSSTELVSELAKGDAASLDGAAVTDLAKTRLGLWRAIHAPSVADEERYQLRLSYVNVSLIEAYRRAESGQQDGADGLVPRFSLDDFARLVNSPEAANGPGEGELVAGSSGVLRLIDAAIIMSPPGPARDRLLAAADLVVQSFALPSMPSAAVEELQNLMDGVLSLPPPAFAVPWTSPVPAIPTRFVPSLVDFQQEAFARKQPMLLRGVIDGWPGPPWPIGNESIIGWRQRATDGVLCPSKSGRATATTKTGVSVWSRSAASSTTQFESLRLLLTMRQQAYLSATLLSIPSSSRFLLCWPT